MHVIFWLETLKGRDHSEEVDTDGKIKLDCISGIWGGNVWTGCIWLGIGSSGGML